MTPEAARTFGGLLVDACREQNVHFAILGTLAVRVDGTGPLVTITDVCDRLTVTMDPTTAVRIAGIIQLIARGLEDTR
jgi:threonine synthase